jgi:hydroxyacylglutathione hydrolase
MILRHYLHAEPTVAISYLFGCGGRAAGAVVDPVAEPSFYLREAETLGLVIRYVVDTHAHADHVSTGRALAAAAGAAYVLHADTDARFPFQGV